MRPSHSRMPKPVKEIYDRVFQEHGYDFDDCHIGIVVLSEANQVIVVCDHRENRKVEAPVEDNILNWPVERIAETACEALDDDTIERQGYI